MCRLSNVFEVKQKNVLSVYCTAGYPQLHSTIEVMKALQDSGADIIELGMPYSDPLADGPVIQHSSSIALANGMTIERLFEQLKNMRPAIHLPVVLMGYLNPVLQFGMENFCAAAKAVGVDAVILPDLPMHEFGTQYKELFEKYGLDLIFLVTPETSKERIRKIDECSGGFIYAVSSSSTTGNSKPVEEQEAYFKKIQDMQLKNPVLVGFGINNKQSFQAACRFTNGAIIGSAYIRALEKSTAIEKDTATFLNMILK